MAMSYLGSVPLVEKNIFEKLEIPVWEQDSSPTPILETVHRQNWRQFTDLMKTVYWHYYIRTNDFWLMNMTYNYK